MFLLINQLHPQLYEIRKLAWMDTKKLRGFWGFQQTLDHSFRWHIDNNMEARAKNLSQLSLDLPLR